VTNRNVIFMRFSKQSFYLRCMITQIRKTVTKKLFVKIMNKYRQILNLLKNFN